METYSVFLPGEFHGQRSLVGYSPQGGKESDTTEQLSHQAVAKEACGKAQRRALSYNADAGRRKARDRGGVPRPRFGGLGRRYPRRRQGVYRLLPRGLETVAEASRVRGGRHGQGCREESADRRVNLWPLVPQG